MNDLTELPARALGASAEQRGAARDNAVTSPEGVPAEPRAVTARDATDVQPKAETVLSEAQPTPDVTSGGVADLSSGPYPAAAATPTQCGPEDVRFDFNEGCRVLLPPRATGTWRARLRDLDTGNILFEAENQGRSHPVVQALVRAFLH